MTLQSNNLWMNIEKKEIRECNLLLLFFYTYLVIFSEYQVSVSQCHLQ